MTAVGSSNPSAKTVDLSALPSPSVSSRTSTLSSGVSPGLIIGYIELLATQSRPWASQFIWIGLAICGSAAHRLTSNPSATLNDLRSISGSGGVVGMDLGMNE